MASFSWHPLARLLRESWTWVVVLESGFVAIVVRVQFISSLFLGDRRWFVTDMYTSLPCHSLPSGDLYPSAEVIGNDVSAIQPNFVPPNVQFEVFDVETTWDYSSPFDYIHCRYLWAANLSMEVPVVLINVYRNGSIRNWPKLMHQAFKSVPIAIHPEPANTKIQTYETRRMDWMYGLYHDFLH